VEITGILCFHIYNFWGRGRIPSWFKLTWASAVPICAQLFLTAHLTLADLWFKQYYGHEIKWSSELTLLEILSVRGGGHFLGRSVLSAARLFLCLCWGSVGYGDKHW